MELKFNNIPVSSAGNLLTLSDVPNILSVNEGISGRKCIFSFIFSGNLKQTVTDNGQYYVTFLDETVTSVKDAANAKNKRFYVSSYPTSTAASFANAMRSCPSIIANFTVDHSETEVELVSRRIGKVLSVTPNYFSTNIPSAYLTTTGYDGDAFSSLYNAKIQIDVFDESNNYLTTLSKTFYENSCSFDVSPLLSTMAEYGVDKKVRFGVSSIATNGEYSYLGDVNTYTTVGYTANQSSKYRVLTGTDILLNTNRNQIRYIYGYEIPFSVLWGIGTAGFTVTYSIKNSMLEELYSTSTSMQTGGYTSHIIDMYWTIPAQYRTLGSYVDITVGGGTTYRFKIIKPLKATEYYQRILWRNEYGGIEFFDFTGSRSETDSVDIETYEKNIFDFYSNPEYESKKIYKNDYKKQVKVTSHLLESNGRWFANSLMRSKKVWTVINGKTHYIIPKSIDVQEDGTYNNIYTVQLTYEYSQLS